MSNRAAIVLLSFLGMFGCMTIGFADGPRSEDDFPSPKNRLVPTFSGLGGFYHLIDGRTPDRLDLWVGGWFQSRKLELGDGLPFAIFPDPVDGKRVDYGPSLTFTAYYLELAVRFPVSDLNLEPRPFAFGSAEGDYQTHLGDIRVAVKYSFGIGGWWLAPYIKSRIATGKKNKDEGFFDSADIVFISDQITEIEVGLSLTIELFNDTVFLHQNLSSSHLDGSDFNPMTGLRYRLGLSVEYRAFEFFSYLEIFRDTDTKDIDEFMAVGVSWHLISDVTKLPEFSFLLAVETMEKGDATATLLFRDDIDQMALVFGFSLPFGFGESS